jgi:tetratricopeptide (TPR) repeat protein
MYDKFWIFNFGIWIIITVLAEVYIPQNAFGQLKTIKLDDTRSSLLNVYEGIEQAIEGYWEAAGLSFKKALKNNSQNYIAYYCHALVLDILDGRISESEGTTIFAGIDSWIFSNNIKAANIFEKIDLNKYGLFYLFKGLNEESLEAYEEALEDYNKTIHLEPEFTYAYVKRGRIFARQRNFEDALKDFNQAIKIDSVYYGGYYERGVVYQELHEYKCSIQDYERAYYLYPALKQTLHESIKICEGYNNLGLDYMKKSKYPEALQNFNDAINWNPYFHEPYLNRGITFRNLGLYEAAISDFNTVLEFDTAQVEIYFNLALVHQLLDDLDKTLNYLKKTKDLEPVHIQTYQVLGEIYYEQRQFKRAIKMFEHVLSLDDKNFLGYYWVALSYDARRQYPEAIQAYENFIKIAPEEYYDQKIKMYERAERLKRWIDKKKQ